MFALELPQPKHPGIRVCEAQDLEQINDIINEAAQAYRGVIPHDCWHEPYMGHEELRGECESGVVFLGFERDRRLCGVMGMQRVRDATLIRHAYVRTAAQRAGIGAALLAEIVRTARLPLLVGTWSAASWAQAFYRRHGFEMVSPEQTTFLLRRYWTISQRQIETSVVLQWNGVHNIHDSDSET